MLRPPLNLDLGEESDELFEKAVKEIILYDRASPSLLQRRLSMGYARAARMMDQLESAGVVGPSEGSKARAVLIRSYDDYLAKGGKPKTEQENVFKVPENYKVPQIMKLSKADKTPWGKQLSEVIGSKDFKDIKAEYPILLGYDQQGKLHSESLLNIGNLIIAGNPFSQKEILVDTILLNLLLRYPPNSLRIIMNDITHYLDLYNGIPHLLDPVINDYGKFISAFRWAHSEMDRRTKQFAQAGIRNFGDYNELSGLDALPHILIITFYNFPNVEIDDPLTILSGQGVRTGIHNILVVDRTNGKNLPNNIKYNIPARLAFKLTSAGESKAIGVQGAEKLEQGEVIYKPNFGSQVKLNPIFTPEINVKEVIESVKRSVDTSL